MKKENDVFSQTSKMMKADNQYKYKKIDRNFRSNNTLTGTASNYEYDVFDNNNNSSGVFKNNKGNGLYDFLKKT
jgi:ribosome-associated toxin RatA of RatAB toxin-antitoxin module